MILSGLEIKKRLGTDIIIDPFNEKQLNPNSYNLRLHHELLLYQDPILDMKKRHSMKHITIPPEGLILEPNFLYLARTAEYTTTQNLVPMLEGRSSIGRLGIFIHITAGFGDVGFSGFWTLEMFCVQPVKVYAGVEICQIFYHTIQGDYVSYSSTKYQHNKGIQPSLLYTELDSP